MKKEHKAAVSFSSLAQGLLTDKYLNGIPADSRVHKSTSPFLHEKQVDETINTVKKLNQVAADRGQTLAEMALAWNLREPEIASVLIGVSRPEQLLDNVKALDNLKFSDEELKKIDDILATQKPIQ